MRTALLAFALAAALPAGAQPVHAGGAAATRSVSHYLALERQLQEAAVARDTGALQARVSSDFTYRSPADADVIERDAWLKREPRRAVPIRDLTVHEDEDIAVVSFVAGRRFVVDLWKGDTLQARWAATSPEVPPAPSRPTGRE